MKSEKRKLTEAVVAKFTCPPDERQAFMWDTEVQGLGVRALPAHVKDGKTRPGAKTWIVAGRVAGTGQERRIALDGLDEIEQTGAAALIAPAFVEILGEPTRAFDAEDFSFGESGFLHFRE
ncbi:MAG: hypothetical protein HUU30_18125 [Burkholderiaceae bacterium]|nr:hypothetical protein [Burkholderiaceae bacterium]